MTPRHSLLIGLGALFGASWLMTVGPGPSHPLPMALAHGRLDADTAQAPEAETVTVPYYSPFEKKLLRHGFATGTFNFFNEFEKFDYVKQRTTLQEVCDLLGCK